MNKIKIFLGIACLTVAIGSVAFTKANAKLTDPEYYFFHPTSGADVCVLAVPDQCDNSTQNLCIKNESSTQTSKQIYTDNACQNVKFDRQ